MSTAEGNNFLVIESHAVEDLEMHELIFSQQSTINILASLECGLRPGKHLEADHLE